ncbi:hypothetical protein [Rubrobacter indicoceani]|uniref:hypothetical protein n=1 Tax=Rubrobacter indicoceani TaxID=2051957 RepID=UPI0013C43E6C|nr:hypothetical protein [Rubrobacter indicoceani]
MIVASVPQTVETIEREIARLRAARPQFRSRIERAESIIVIQLSVPKSVRPVKVRIHSDGTRSYSVTSSSKLRRVYTVEAGTFACDCPDSRRRHAACKHGIACWLLEKMLEEAGNSRPLSPAPAASSSPCSGCGEDTPSRELTEVQDWHESLSYFEGDMLCEECLSGSDCW